jgi:hypothetical protein
MEIPEERFAALEAITKHFLQLRDAIDADPDLGKDFSKRWPL